MFIAKRLADGSTLYRSRVTGLRYIITTHWNGRCALYREGEQCIRNQSRRVCVAAITNFDLAARYMQLRA